MRFTVFLAAVLILAAAPVVMATSYEVTDGFETSWSPGNYAPGWDNGTYRWGTPATAAMTQYATVTVNGHVITPQSGSYFMGLKVTAPGSPEPATNWWGGVDAGFVSAGAMARQYAPWVSVSFYDTGLALPSPQLAVVPNSGNPADWTDVQFGQRWNRADHYWRFEGMTNTWTETTVDRTAGWHELKLSQDTSGIITFYIDGASVGTTTAPLLDLNGAWLMTQFNDGVYAESEVYFDNFQAGSNVPEPVTMLSVFGAVAGIGAYLRRRKSVS